MPMQTCLLLSILVLLSGCTSYGVIENQPKAAVDFDLTVKSPAQMATTIGRQSSEVSVLLAFSGGGHRAAALSYGVLKAIREVPVESRTGTTRLLDHVDAISAVSGGTFTAAYYGLVGDRIFDDYERRFLSWDMEQVLLSNVRDLSHLLSDRGRSEIMVDLLDASLFNGATIDDINRLDGPTIILNASDLGRGVRLSFLPSYFDLLCSDVRRFPVARAVTASAAVPLVFNPIVVRNYDDCGSGSPQWLHEARQRLADNEEMSLVIDGLASYGDKQKRRYIHLVDGGITDNLGLRAVYENVELSGGIQSTLQRVGREVPRRVVVIAVDASTHLDIAMDQTLEEPGIEETVNGITDAQLHRYNAATLTLFEQEVKRWAAQMSAAQERPVSAYFIRLSLQQAGTEALKRYYNDIPTGLSLTPEQMTRLVAAGRTLLFNHPEFIRFQND